jgi:hypothetical protein
MTRYQTSQGGNHHLHPNRLAGVANMVNSSWQGNTPARPIGHDAMINYGTIMDVDDEFHSAKPREQVGRDTFARYRAQVRAASLAALAILEGKETDRIYCDYHDDFVIRKIKSGRPNYLFVQVKTRGKTNKNWTINEIFGLKKSTKSKKATQDPKLVKDSFGGKLLQHTITFPETCAEIVFMTNSHLDDLVESIADCLAAEDSTNEYVKFLSEKFNECFDPDSPSKIGESDALARMAKLRFETDVQYIKEKNHNFESLARSSIYDYSEIDLDHNESKQIIIGLLELTSKKSSGKIINLTESAINENASIEINDLLDLLSISREAYQALLNGDDPKAIKSASVIQRALASAGASNDEIEYASRCKTSWDIWLRENRNRLSDFDIISINSYIDESFNSIFKSGKSLKLSDANPIILQLKKRLTEQGIIFDLDPNLLLGGFFSALVRCKS